jgi:hypothetical protein
VPIALLASRARYRTGQPCLLAAAAAVGRANAHVWQLSGRVDVDAGGPYGIGWQRLLIWHVGDGDIPATARRRAGPRQVGVSLALIRVRGIVGTVTGLIWVTSEGRAGGCVKGLDLRQQGAEQGEV